MSIDEAIIGADIHTARESRLVHKGMPRPVPRDEVRAEAVLQMLRIVEVVINIDAVQRTRPPDFSAVISLLIGSK